MRHSQITLVVFAVCMVVPLSVGAQAFRALRFLDPNAPDRYSLARAVSGDGTTVVGESNGQAFRWTAATL